MEDSLSKVEVCGETRDKTTTCKRMQTCCHAVTIKCPESHHPNILVTLKPAVRVRTTNGGIWTVQVQINSIYNEEEPQGSLLLMIYILNWFAS